MMDEEFLRWNVSWVTELTQRFCYKRNLILEALLMVFAGDKTMYCPTCAIEFSYLFDLAHGLHVDYRCACGQLLQWDYPCQALRDAVFSIVPPRPCKHGDLR